MYINEVTQSTGFSPLDGTKDINALKIRIKLLENSKTNRKYPDINIGDEVRIYNKGRGLSSKTFASNKWSEDTYKVDKIIYGTAGRMYKLEGRKDTFLRSNLLKV